MKYIKAKVQELDKVNNIFAVVSYIEFKKDLGAVAIYTISNVDTIYLSMEERNYEHFLNQFIDKEVVIIDKMCFVQPFEDLLETASKKNKETYDLKHDEIRKKADMANSKKK